MAELLVWFADGVGMRLVVRWDLAVVVSVAVFAGAWWVCQERIGVDEDAALGVAGAVLAVSAWWAARDRPGADSGAGGTRVVQKARGGRDVNVAGRDQTIITYRRGNE